MTVLTLIGGMAQFVHAQSDSAASDLPAHVSRLMPGLSAEEIQTLIETGEISNLYGPKTEHPISVRLAPEFGSDINGDLTTLDPTIGVEVLVLTDSPTRVSSLTPQLMTTLKSVSTMAGIEYYSASRGRMRTLFHESYAIASPDDRTRIGDPIVTAVERSSALTVFQRDSSFGSNVLALRYSTTDSAVRLRMQNLTQMFYMGFIPAVGANELELDLVVYPLGDRLLFYGNAGARPLALLGMEDRVRDSFYNRLIALKDWFVARSSVR